MSKFTNLLKEKREEKRMLKKDVANYFNWGPMYYGRFENGQVTPKGLNIKKFANFLEISEDKLIKILEEDEKNKVH